MCEQTLSQTINPQTTTNPQLRVYVANLGKYNEGELCGNWINLPTTNNEIKTFLKNQVGLNNRYEEYSIQDYESDFNLGGYENIYDLNLLAVKLEQMSEHEKNLAATYCNANGLKDTTSLLNVCHQINDLSYITIDANAWGSREEKLGYAIIDEIDTDLKDTLEQCKLGTSLTAYDYFDFEKYGRDIEINEGYFASGDIFIFYTSDIDPKLYTVEEVKDSLNDPRL
ncbi:MAG: antirestriction protein ArdA [Nitrososphaerota archaeon]|jgi:antirestriction protein|nr:antirestriction protein ArdA [Nitrososphaerota archaeon]